MKNSFLIIKLSSLGDIIHTLPAFSLLRKKFPQSKISWVVDQKGKEILKLVPNLSEIITIDSFRWRKNLFSLTTWKEIAYFRNNIKTKFSVAIDFQGLLKSGIIAFLSRAKKRIGFNKKNLKESIASIFYTQCLKEIPENTHIIKKNLKLLSLLGLEEEIFEFPLKLTSEIYFQVEEKLTQIDYNPPKKLVLINIGGGWETKRWEIEKFIVLAKKINAQGYFPVFLWGTESERKLALQASKEAEIPFLPFLTISEVIALTKKASLMISGDTFPLHIATALSTPVVGIYGPTDPERNGPFHPWDKVAVHPLPCSFCFKRKCSSIECLTKISVDQVLNLTFQALRENVS
ncbi:MAG: lipopolysaccharide heptosyltransferase I [Candidatus Aminicenantia bacterium]